MRTFVDNSTTPSRFWNIELQDSSYTVTSGKVGSKGRTSKKEFADEASARKEHDRLIRKKLAEGFEEATPQPSSSPTRLGLEAALAANPDDLAAHRAYADFLSEQGEPRGELIQVQLALENPNLPAGERQRALAREKELLARLADDCLGSDLVALRARYGTDYQADWQPYAFDYTIRRGWLHRVVHRGPLDTILAVGLVNAPGTRLLRELIIRTEFYPEMIQHDDPGLAEVVGLLHRLKHLRVLGLLRPEEEPGFAPVQNEPIIFTSRWALLPAGDPVWDWIAALPELEELYLSCLTRNTARLFGLPSLTRLRILQLNLTEDYPLAALARNPALKNLTHLSFHPPPNRDNPNRHYLTAAHLAELARSPNLPALTHLRFQRSGAGDDGVRVLVDSGLLRRLEFLDLAMGTITDAGAELLAGADTGALKVLDVSANAISAAGQARLRSALNHKLTLRLDNQARNAQPEWLYEGEVE